MFITDLTQMKPDNLYRCRSKEKDGDFVILVMKNMRCKDVFYYKEPKHRHYNVEWGPAGSLLLSNNTVEHIGNKQNHLEYFL